jgi:uncharacterized protein YegL
MRKTRLTRYLLFSIFLHMGVLLGMSAFLKAPATVVVVELVPVDAVFLEEEPYPPEFEPAASEQVTTGETVETKSERSAGTETHLDVPDLAGPVPKEGRFEPSLNVESLPTLGVVPTGREGKEVVSKPVVSTPKMPPLRLSPVRPSRSDEPSPLEADIPRVLAEAETGGSGPFSQTQKKIDAPIGRTRSSADLVAELPPIPTVESPSIPEQRDMILAPSQDLQQTPSETVEQTRRTGSITQPESRLALAKPSSDIPQLIVPEEEPTILDPKGNLSFPVPGSKEGAAFLFVLDTSGSVKGVPLEGIKKSAREFVGLMGPKDRAGIMTFNDAAELVRPFTSQKGRLVTDIERIQTRGELTVLFDALMQAVDLIEKEDREKRFVILFSDGKDEGSHATTQEVIERIRRSGVSILCVGYSKVEKRYLGTLKNIAAETGGISADAPQFHDILMLYKAARAEDISQMR